MLVIGKSKSIIFRSLPVGKPGVNEQAPLEVRECLQAPFRDAPDMQIETKYVNQMSRIHVCIKRSIDLQTHVPC